MAGCPAVFPVDEENAGQHLGGGHLACSQSRPRSSGVQDMAALTHRDQAACGGSDIQQRERDASGMMGA